MAFKQFKLDRSSEQSRGIFNKYVYETEDTVSHVQSQGYFTESRFSELDGPDTNSDGWDGGYIICKCSDGSFAGYYDKETETLTPASATAIWRGGISGDSGLVKDYLTSNDTPQVIPFNSEGLTSELFEADLGAGTIQVKVNGIMSYDVFTQGIRETPGGVTYLGIFVQVEIDGVGWVDLPDSLFVSTFKSTETNDIQPQACPGVTQVQAGQKFRIMQITDDFTKDIGVIADKPFANAPSQAALVLSLQVFY